MKTVARRPTRRFRRLVLFSTLLAPVISALFPAGALAQDDKPPTGGQVFMGAHCNICHGQMGSGGAGPALRNNRMLAVTDYVVAQILLGRGIMPSFADQLSDAEIAAVATYIRTSWGNRAGPVDAAKVASIRQLLQQEKALPVAQNGE
jgi:mono/diheme cytochrome c family protein